MTQVALGLIIPRMEFFIKAVLMGVLQGIAEFLPISSSGHLAIAEHFFKVTEPGGFFEVALHIGTLASVVVYYRNDLISLTKSFYIYCAGLVGKKIEPENPEEHASNLRFILGVIIASIPTGLMGVFLEDYFESLFKQVEMIAIALFITAAILVISETISSKHVESEGAKLTPLKAFFIGVMQGVAIAPGISRSGSTMGAGLLSGLKPQEAARFSFLVSIPAILGAVVLKLDDVGAIPAAEVPGYIGGAIVAGIIGYFAIGVLINVAKKGRLKWFAAYCVLAGTATIIASRLLG